jgi:hypothetical protein
MLAAAQPGEHAILADWIEEHLQLDELAAILRVTENDPRSPAQKDHTHFSGFRYRLLDCRVMLFCARFEVHEGYQGGKKKKAPEGHVVGMCLSADAVKGPLRYVRWLPSEVTCPAFPRLWHDLATGRPVVKES